jgi:hypothetical protein
LVGHFVVPVSLCMASIIKETFKMTSDLGQNINKSCKYLQFLG